MSETMSQGLLLSAIGMGMVFAALAALWALIALIGRVGAWSAARGAQKAVQIAPVVTVSAGTSIPSDEEMAAISIALLLLHAEEDTEAGLRWRLPPLLTRWVAVGYGRQLQSWQPPRGRHHRNG